MQNCKFCGKDLITKKTRFYCDRSCAARGRNNALFEEPQIIFLLKRLQRCPPQLLIDEFIMKFPGFTRQQIQTKITALAKSKNISTVSTHRVWALSDLAKTLGISYDRVRSWQRKYNLRSLKRKGKTWRGNRVFVYKKDIETFALERPDLFKEIKMSSLRKVIDNKAAIASVLNYSNISCPKTLVIIKLNDGSLFASATEAMKSMNCEITDKGILYNCSVDRPMMNGTNWYKLQYPCIEVPKEVRAEFLHLAGLIFYQLYNEFKHLAPPKSCLIVAARSAVAIALMTFKRHARNQMECIYESKNAIASFYQECFIKNVRFFYGKTQSTSFQIIKSQIISIASPIFKGAYFNSNEAITNAEEFALHMISKASESFFKKGFLPSSYSPLQQLELADYYATIAAICTKACLYSFKSEKRIRLCVIYALQWIKKNPSHGSTVYNSDYKQHNILTASTELQEIIENLEAMNIADELKALCKSYISSVKDGADSFLTEEDEAIALNTLRLAANPF